MFKMKKILLFLSVFLCCACSDNDEPTPEAEAPMTVLAYLVADASNIDDDIWANVAAMYDGLASMKQSATLLIYWDGSSNYGLWDYPVIMKYETDGRGNVNGKKQLNDEATIDEVAELAKVVKTYSPQLSTDKQVMSKVLKDMVSLSPTSKVGLIAASHGSAWLNTIFTRSFGQDGKGTDNTILIKDMAEAMQSTGKTFEFLLYDACFMGTTEVCYDLRNVTHYQIVSAMEVPAYGFPYETSLGYLYEGTVAGYKQICQSYIDFYKQKYERGSQAWGTIALVDSKEMQALANEVKAEITTHKEILSDYDVSVLQEYGRDGGPYIAYDLGQFVKDLNNDNLPSSFSEQLNKTILYKGCLEMASPSDYSVDASNFCGLGIYIPTPYKSSWNTFFKTIDWYTAAGWNEISFDWYF